MAARFLRVLAVLFAAAILHGCASVNGPPEAHDPYERFNRSVYQFNDTFDRRLLRPVAETYDEYVPAAVNTAVSNFFSNLDDVLVLLNDVLQARPHQAGSDLSRLVWNTTVGLGGLIDVATPMNLPKHEEDFGQTLGAWGVEPGPYLVLPFLGPSTLRDGTGTVATWVVEPVAKIEDPATYWTTISIRAVDRRADLLRASRLLEEAALDPYIFTREAYLQYRANAVHNGQRPADEDPFAEDFDEEAETPPP